MGVAAAARGWGCLAFVLYEMKRMDGKEQSAGCWSTERLGRELGVGEVGWGNSVKR